MLGTNMKEISNKIFFKLNWIFSKIRNKIIGKNNMICFNQPRFSRKIHCDFT